MSESGRRVPAEERLREEVVELRSEIRRLTTRIDRQQDDIASLTASFEELSVRGEESRGSASDLGASSSPLPILRYSPLSATPCQLPEDTKKKKATSAFLAPARGDCKRNWTLAEEGARRGSQAELRKRPPSLSIALLYCGKDHAGNTYQNPVLVFSRFTPVRDLCQRGADWAWAHSIFIGVPSQREGQVAVVAAGLDWLASQDSRMMDGMSEDGGVPSRPPSEEREGLGVGGILQPRECLVQQEDFVDNEYSLGSLDLVGEEPQNCAVIAIGLCQGKLLVGVPEAVWHRSLSRRRLPPKALSRPVLAAVVACSATKRAEDADIVASTKVWIGLLDPMMEKEISYVEGLDFDHHFGLVGEELALPYGKALVEVANEHFGFVTAESEVQQPHGTVPPLEDRLRMLEENLEALRGSLAAIAGEARGGGRAVPLPAKPSPKPAQLPRICQGWIQPLSEPLCKLGYQHTTSKRWPRP